jgi:hypothetical protein
MGPFYNLLAVLSMMAGVFIPYKLATQHHKVGNVNSMLKQKIALIVISATALGMIVRVAVMSVTNYFALPQSAPIGLSIPTPDTVAILPLIAVFNASVAFYTVPIGIGIAAAITPRFKLK